MENFVVAIVVICFLGVFLGVGIIAILCKACSLCSLSCSCARVKENITRSPFHPEVMDLTLERVTPINRYFRIRRQQVKIVEPEKKETNDDTKNNLLNQV